DGLTQAGHAGVGVHGVAQGVHHDDVRIRGFVGANVYRGGAVMVAIHDAWKSAAALVAGHTAGNQSVVAGVDGRAAGQQGARQRRPAVVGQRAQDRIAEDGVGQPAEVLDVLDDIVTADQRYPDVVNVASNCTAASGDD